MDPHTPLEFPDAVGPGAGGSVEIHGPRGHGHPHHHPHHRVSGRMRRRLVIVLLVAIGLGGAAAGAAMMSGFLPNSVVAGDPKASGHGEVKPTGPPAAR